MKFLVDPTVMYRFAEGNFVYDGIAPYPICPEDFTFKFGKGLTAHLGDAPAGYDGAPGYNYFSLMQGRPVHDGLWASQNPVDSTEGLPLTFHGFGPKTKFFATFALDLERHTIPSLDFPDAFGTYGKKGFRKSTFNIFSTWGQNVVLNIKLDKVEVSKPA